MVHIGGGWETGKSISTFIDGLAFGLVYLLYGVQAPILLHWFFNYYISGYGAYGLALDFYPTISPIFLLIFLGTLILGVLGWTMFTALLGARLYRRRKRAVPPQPLRLPPPKPSQPIARSCLRCGQLFSEDAKFCPYCGKSIEEEKEES